MRALFKKYWLFPAIVLVVMIASSLGGKGTWVQEYHVITIGIFLAFFVTGLSLDTSYLNLRDLQAKAAITAIISSFIPSHLHRESFSVFQQCIVLLIIFNAFASSGGKIGTAGAMLPALVAFIDGLHSLILLLNNGICKVIRLDRPSTTAFTIHTSQKTLAVSYLVWASCFAAQYPLALIPGIIYHLTQMVMDTLVAERFKKLSFRN